MCVLFIISGLLLCVFVIYFCTHAYTKIIQNRVLKDYLKLDNYLSKRYELISQILNEFQDNSFSFNKEKIQSLKEEAVSLGTNLKNIDRRIAFDNELAIKMNELIASMKNSGKLSSDSKLGMYIAQYLDLDKIINKIIKTYNLKAGKLKTVTEVFPSSFVTRFNGIKPLDLYKEV